MVMMAVGMCDVKEHLSSIENIFVLDNQIGFTAYVKI